MAYRLKAQERVPKAIGRIALEELESAAGQLSDKDPRNRDTAIHEARKSVKKVRALLRLMRLELGPAFRGENRRFRNLGRKLSRFREPAADIETFDDLVAKRPKELGKSIHIRRALIQRKRESDRRGAMGRSMGAIAAAFRDVEGRVAKWPLQYDGFAAIEPGLAKTFRQGRRALASVRKDPSAENYHEWRKRVKDHWYQVRLLGRKPADSMQARVKRLHRLETWLGKEHNLALLLETIDARPRYYGSAPSVERFLKTAGDYQKKLQKKALSLGGRIYNEKTSHFIGRMRGAFDGQGTRRAV